MINNIKRVGLFSLTTLLSVSLISGFAINANADSQVIELLYGSDVTAVEVGAAELGDETAELAEPVQESSTENEAESAEPDSAPEPDTAAGDELDSSEQEDAGTDEPTRIANRNSAVIRSNIASELYFAIGWAGGEYQELLFVSSGFIVPEAVEVHVVSEGTGRVISSSDTVYYHWDYWSSGSILPVRRLWPVASSRSDGRADHIEDLALGEFGILATNPDSADSWTNQLVGHRVGSRLLVVVPDRGRWALDGNFDVIEVEITDAVASNPVAVPQLPVILGVPTKTGTARVGGTLTAQAGTVEPGTTLAFQWLRGAQEIPGATGRTFQLTEADGGQNIRVRVTASRAHHRAATRTSANQRVTGIIRGGTARITGTSRVGSRLTANVSGFTPTGTASRFQWLRNGQPIAGATARTYVLGNADGGQRISVRVTATRAHHEDRVVTSGAVNVPGRANQVHLTGTALVGNTLRANTTMITPRPARFEFQWLRNGQVIRNATAATYRLVAADAGQNISVRVTAIRAGSAPARITSPNTRVQGVIQSGTARITGNQTVGSRLTANVMGFTPGGTTLRFQWLRNGQPIAGATASTYVLQAADAGNRVSVRVTATRTHHNPRTVTSATITAR